MGVLSLCSREASEFGRVLVVLSKELLPFQTNCAFGHSISGLGGMVILTWTAVLLDLLGGLVEFGVEFGEGDNCDVTNIALLIVTSNLCPKSSPNLITENDSGGVMVAHHYSISHRVVDYRPPVVRRNCKKD